MAAVVDATTPTDRYTLRFQPALSPQQRCKILLTNKLRSCCTSSSERGDLTVLIIGSRADLLRLLACVVALVLVACLVLVLTAVGDRASVAVVCVDAAEYAAITSEDIVNDDVASTAVAAAVTA